MTNKKLISVARDYSKEPGARYRTDGPNSGEVFRKQHLEPLFADVNDNSKFTVDLDGAEGYATSFLEEAFGGLARIYGIERVRKRLELKSIEDPSLIDDVNEYIRDCNDV
jgi:hypothetical protein